MNSWKGGLRPPFPFGIEVIGAANGCHRGRRERGLTMRHALINPSNPIAMNDSNTVIFASISGAFIAFEPSTAANTTAPKSRKMAKAKKSCGQCLLCKCKRIFG